jgi:hypothetical protein
MPARNKKETHEMSGNMPSKDNAALVWLEAHIERWTSDPASIGLTAAQASELSARITAARQARIDADERHDLAQAATALYHDHAARMKDYASALITTIKAFAANASDPSQVRQAAAITAPAPRTPADPPEQPAITRARLGGTGTITIDFKGRGPTGTVWQVQRKRADETAFSYIGTADVATKSFTDTTLPAGTASAAYRVQGVRGSLIGPASFPMTVGLGSAKPTGLRPGESHHTVDRRAA